MRVTVDLGGFDAATKALIDRFSERRINAAAATALTRTARAVEKVWGNQLRNTLDRPTRATTEAVVVKQATASNLTAEVFIKDQAGSRGTAPVEWLLPDEIGGPRKLKKFEQALIAQGSMPAGMRAVPGPAAKLDAYGNVSRGTIVQVIAQLGAQYSPGYRQVISKSAVKRAQKALLSGREYVAIPRPRGQLKAGIYQRKGRALLAVFYFVGRTTYRAITGLNRTAERTVVLELGDQFLRALDESAQRLAGAAR